jgi:hypothetical protein
MVTEPLPVFLSDDDVEEFRRLMAAEFGEELSYDEAWRRAQEVVSLFRMLVDAANSRPHRSGSTADAPDSPDPTDSQ